MGHSIEQLSQVGVIVFFLAIYSAISIQLWAGLLHSRCYDNITRNLVPGPDMDANCAVEHSTLNGYPRQCPEGQVCLLNADNPADNIVSFDNFLHAAFTWFQVCSLVDWSKTMYMIFDSWRWGRWAFPVFLSYIICVAYSCINLVLAAITIAFEQ